MMIVSSELHEVHAFMNKFKIPMADEPSFLDPKTFAFRTKFMLEELNEFMDAHDKKDLPGAADALVDLCYVLHGTVLMMGLPWFQAWNEVHKANMKKERTQTMSQSKRKSNLDVIKPEGWKAPDHSKFLGDGPWPVFDAGAK